MGTAFENMQEDYSKLQWKQFIISLKKQQQPVAALLYKYSSDVGVAFACFFR